MPSSSSEAIHPSRERKAARNRSMLIAGLGGCGCLGVTIVAVLLLFVFGGRFGETSNDQDLIRAELSIPNEAPLISLTTDPADPGMFGREGLRVVAVFELDQEDFDRFRTSRAALPYWSSLPISPSIMTFDYPPVELPAANHGLFFCQVGVWNSGTDFAPHSCESPPNRFHHYRVAVLDDRSRRLSVVFKNYY